jgi:putative SOS response-associated peptidase YedK
VCGRYTSTTPAADLAAYFLVDEVAGEAPGPRWNVAPTDEVWMVGEETGEQGERRWLRRGRWGLVPAWATTSGGAGGAPLINARTETVLERSAFRGPFTAGRRCLVPADGFYEWQAGQAWHLRPGDGRPLAFAGLWERWRPPDRPDAEVRSCTILTAAANDDVAPLHDRMPVVIDPADFDRWLDPEYQRVEGLTPLLRPYPAEALEAVAVSARVNSPKNDGPECLAPAG